MAIPTIDQLADGVLQAQLLNSAQCEEFARMKADAPDARMLAQDLMRRRMVTAFQINQILLGKGDSLHIGPFLLLERVGEGGMGQVFKAKQKNLDRIVALKVIRRECLSNPKVIQRFQREIRATGALNHPHIVRAFDADQVHGTYYIAMEFIEGDDLAKLVKNNGPLPVNQACDYIRQAALGLQHAHERGLVHRDIKPANLLVTRSPPNDRRRASGMIPRPQGKNAPGNSGLLARAELPTAYPWGMVKILDMGLARCTDRLANWASTHLTQIGSVMGTPEYIAPEQARDSHTSDVRADLYSLGCTLYFLLTGQAPFPNGTMTEKLLQHQTDIPASVGFVRRESLQARLEELGAAEGEIVSNQDARVPSVIVSLIAKLMAKNPEDRYQTPIELANELQTIVQQIADGTLPSEEPSDTVEMPPMKGSGEKLPTSAGFLTSTGEVSCIVALAKNPFWAKRRPGAMPIVLAALGGLALMAMLTFFALLLSRGNITQAGTASPQPVWKSKSIEPENSRRP